MSNLKLDDREQYRQNTFVGLMFVVFVIGLLLSGNAVADKATSDHIVDSITLENERLKLQNDSLKSVNDSLLYPIMDIDGVKNYIE